MSSVSTVSRTAASVPAPTTGPSQAPSAESQPLLADPNNAALPILGQLHLLMLKASQTAREANRKEEDRFEQEESQADAARLSQMKEKADEALKSALFSAGLQIATSVATVVATSAQIGATASKDAASRGLATAEKNLEVATAASKVPDRVAIPDTVARLTDARDVAKTAAEAAKSAAEKTDLAAKLVEGSNKGVDGLRTGLKAVGDSRSDYAQVRITELENKAKAARRAADRLKSEQDAAKQSEAKICQLAKEISDAQAQCERAALMRLA